MTTEKKISGRREVLEALKSGIPVERVVIRLGSRGEIIGRIIAEVKARKIRLDRLPLELFDRQFRSGDSGGVAAFVGEVGTVEMEDFLQKAEERLESPFIVLLDGIEDPHNLGAIARSAEGAGCHGLVIPQRRIAPLSEAAVKASSGALLHLPVARVSNISEAIRYLKKEKIWIFGADMKGENYREVEYPAALALIIGAEGRGLSKNVRGLCDRLISIPLRGKIESLNASVSAGIILFEIASHR